MQLRLLTGLFCLLTAFASHAQVTFPQAAPSDERAGLFALTGATVYVDYKTRIDSATLIVRDGKVEACARGLAVPKDAVQVDCKGKTIYPAFIDLYAGYGLPAPAAEGKSPTQRPQQYSNKQGAYAWNEALKPEFEAAKAFAADAKVAEEWRKIGFGTLLVHRTDGISRGSGALVALSDLREHESILNIQASHHLSFRKGTSTQDYPQSLMGAIALLRQTYIDGAWYQNAGYKQETNLSLASWNAVQSLPQIFEASDKLDVLRIHSLGKEFGKSYIVKTAGDEYQRLDAIKATGQPLIVPLVFPEGYDVRDPYDALNVSLRDLKHWELAPTNAARIAAAGIPFALTTSGLKDKNKFFEVLRKAIENGLSEEQALKALTFEPATMLRSYDRVGSLEKGKTASFIVCSGNIFQKEGKIHQTWVQGKRFDFQTTPVQTLPLGDYFLGVDSVTYTLLVKGKPEAPEAQVMKTDSSKVKATLSLSVNGLLSLSFQPDTSRKEVITLSGTAGPDGWKGSGTMPDGSWTSWNAFLVKAGEPEAPKKIPTPAKSELGAVVFPFSAYGTATTSKAETVLIKNATLWTNEKDGILAGTDIILRNGKIDRYGKNLTAPAGARVIEGKGKHVTAGIIDEHSHIAVSRSVNEGTQESSAEVRIGDALDSEDIDIYRQLAGGVTSSHLLHGSANPIGGQTQLIKLRWGATPEELKFKNWPGQIKFALGENVKQSNWGDNNRTRYPQTRMGVEQVCADYFTRARAYGDQLKKDKNTRRDLELEALHEILESKRFITCHSYVQSEITMLMRVAEKFGFKVNTFTHILEGYKVADKMAKHGAGGSTFSDWWAYKHEVYEAIPYNAKMMQDRGVVVAINSDDAEMARRLNQEAAKAVMYGGMKEEDALKLVTLNPAKLLHVDDRVGSLKPGKDADVVLWNHHPLSQYAKAEKTWVDGILYFDVEEDGRRRDALQKERARIIQKLLNEKKGGEGGEKPTVSKKYYHCDSDMDEG